MSTDLDFVEFVTDQIDNEKEISYRKMFGEYALYCNNKVVGLICDNQLFIKITKAGRAFVGNITEAPAYLGAKPSFLIENEIDNREWMSKLIKLTEHELPKPKPKKKKSRIKKNITNHCT
jgi:TfoX/Sxy family transcriptional regulator of competence genes